jgi:hypothetical protein
MLPHHQERSLDLLLGHKLLTQRRMKSELVLTRWEVEVEKSFKQQLHMATWRKSKPNLNQVIDNIQVKPVELVVLNTKSKQHVVVTTKISQPIQLVVEHVHVENS